MPNCPANFFGFAVAREVETAIEEHGHIAEDLVLFFPIGEVAEVDDVLIGAPTLSVFSQTSSQLFRICIRKRAQQHCIDDTKDRGVSADTERQRQAAR